MLRDMFEYSDIRDNSIIEKYINEYSRRIEQWSDDVVEQYVKELLEDLLLFVYNNNSYYRKILDEAGYDTCKKFDKKAFSKIHILEKNEIRDDCNLIRCIEMSDVAQIHVSTGTTGGEIIYMMYSFGDLYTRDGAIEYLLLTS
jgi:phenylacetate-coenzyme A ligase